MTEINTTGTSYRGQFRLPYAQVGKLLGKPNGYHDGYKTDAEWAFEKDGVVATVYNYKNGPSYTGRGRVEDIEVWNIGGFDIRAVYLVSDKLGGKGELQLFK